MVSRTVSKIYITEGQRKVTTRLSIEFVVTLIYVDIKEFDKGSYSCLLTVYAIKEHGQKTNQQNVELLKSP